MRHEDEPFPNVEYRNALQERLAHPVRARRGGLPSAAAPTLRHERSAVLWASRAAA